jgi:hypothetical protein
MSDQLKPYRWQKGMPSPNPKGRPRTGHALAEMIREVAGEPAVMRDLLHLVLDVAFGRSVCIEPAYIQACADARRDGLPMPPRPDKAEALAPSITEMQRAWEFLASWGFKKPAQEIEMTPIAGQDRVDLGRLSEAELAQLEALQLKAAGILDLSEK